MNAKGALPTVSEVALELRDIKLRLHVLEHKIDTVLALSEEVVDKRLPEIQRRVDSKWVDSLMDGMVAERALRSVLDITMREYIGLLDDEMGSFEKEISRHIGRMKHDFSGVVKREVNSILIELTTPPHILNYGEVLDFDEGYSDEVDYGPSENDE